MAGIDNLKPFKKGDDPRRNLEGRPKGARSLSTIIQNVAENIEAWDKIPVKNKDVVKQMGAPIDAVILVAYGQAVAGDKSAREWLRKAGYGDSIDITTGGDKITPILGGLTKNVSADDSDTEASET